MMLVSPVFLFAIFALDLDENGNSFIQEKVHLTSADSLVYDCVRKNNDVRTITFLNGNQKRAYVLPAYLSCYDFYNANEFEIFANRSLMIGVELDGDVILDIKDGIVSFNSSGGISFLALSVVFFLMGWHFIDVFRKNRLSHISR